MPVSIFDLQIVAPAVLRLEDVQLRNVEDNPFSVRGGDSPLALLSTIREDGGVGGIGGGGEGSGTLLEGAATTYRGIRTSKFVK